MNIDPSGLSVEVRCLNVQQGHWGLLLGVTHCRVHVTDSSGNCSSMEWNGMQNVGPQGLETQPCFNNGYPAQVTRGRPCGGFENCVTSTFELYENNPKLLGTYNAKWNNSNMFIQHLIESCGGSVHFPKYVFWYYPQGRTYGGNGLIDPLP